MCLFMLREREKKNTEWKGEEKEEEGRRSLTICLLHFIISSSFGDKTSPLTSKDLHRLLQEWILNSRQQPQSSIGYQVGNLINKSCCCCFCCCKHRRQVCVFKNKCNKKAHISQFGVNKVFLVYTQQAIIKDITVIMMLCQCYHHERLL